MVHPLWQIRPALLPQVQERYTRIMVACPQHVSVNLMRRGDINEQIQTGEPLKPQPIRTGDGPYLGPPRKSPYHDTRRNKERW